MQPDFGVSAVLVQSEHLGDLYEKHRRMTELAELLRLVLVYSIYILFLRHNKKGQVLSSCVMDEDTVSNTREIIYRN